MTSSSLQLALLEMIELGANRAPLSQWQALVARCGTLELQPMEEVELLERAAIEAAGLGEVAVGRSLYGRVLEVSLLKPNLMSERVARKLTPLFET